MIPAANIFYTIKIEGSYVMVCHNDSLFEKKKTNNF
jgi:hypothetical protein